MTEAVLLKLIEEAAHITQGVVGIGGIVIVAVVIGGIFVAASHLANWD